MLEIGRYRCIARRVVLQMLAGRTRRTLVIRGTVLVVAPHPDDETFGTGSLIATATRRDSWSANTEPRVHIAFLTSGTASHRGCCEIPDAILAAKREAAASRAAAILGIPKSNLHFLRLRDGALPSPGDIEFEPSCWQLAEIISRIKPQQVFTTNPFEGWPDHLAAEVLTRSTLRQARVEAELYQYCVWFWIKLPIFKALRADWSHALVLETSRVRAKKEQAIRTYLEDLAPCSRPYCGRLPKELLHAFEWEKELFFRVPWERW